MTQDTEISELTPKYEDDTFLRTNESLRSEVEALHAKLAVAERKNREYFSLIERVLAQRDEWKNLHEQHISERAAGLDLYERNILGLRQMLGKTLELLNDARKRMGEPPIETPEELLNLVGPPVGYVAEYWERHKLLTAELRRGIVDAIAERDAIASAP